MFRESSESRSIEISKMNATRGKKIAQRARSISNFDLDFCSAVNCRNGLNKTEGSRGEEGSRGSGSSVTAAVTLARSLTSDPYFLACNA